MTTLSELTVRNFTELLGSDAPAPGGGSAAALAGSLGAALCAMVADLTLGREKYAEFQGLAEESSKKAGELRGEFLAAMERDTEVFNSFGAAMALPKGSDGEKAARTKAMQEALTLCIESPLHMMELSDEALRLTAGLVGKSNQNAASDLAVSALMLEAAVRGAWLNVLINLSSLKDKDAAAAFRRKAEEILGAAEKLAREIYSEVEKTL